MSLNSLNYRLPDALEKSVEAVLEDWHENKKVEKLWSQDASIWTNADEANWLGWLGVVERQLADQQKFADFQKEIAAENFSHILLLGMGGSSLCPEVLSFTFGKQAGYPELLILDSTDPAQIRAVEAKIDLQKTLFFVSSKSGSTLEPNIFQAYFFDRLASAVDSVAAAGKHFVAVTDPGSKMQQVAEENGFRKIFFGDPAIGGRYSALSDFGMIPLAAMGIDVANFLQKTNEMARACQTANPAENPGVTLGAILGAARRDFGRDKVTVFTSPKIFDLGAWLEQLIAESTGKSGKSLIPVDRETIQEPENYGTDRVFAYLKVEGDDEFDAAVERLEKSGQPVVRIVLKDTAHLGQEFFRWEIATAVAGSIMEINPFNQPDVEASKIETKKLTSQYEETGSLPAETPIYEGENIKLFTDEHNRAELETMLAEGKKSLAEYLKTHFERIEENDYFGLLAYVEMNEENRALLQAIRRQILENYRAATCLGFGPRFLHSTGQAYKGGANNGVFLQITADDEHDLQVPNQKYTFGTVKAAQARGDFEVLAERGRRVLRVHLGADVIGGLEKILKIIE